MLLPSGSAAKGRRVNWRINGDKHPARIASEPIWDRENGAPRQMVEIVVFRATRDGSKTYLSRRIAGAFFLDPRTNLVPELDQYPNVEDLIEAADTEFTAYQAERAAESDVASLASMLATD